MKGLKMSKINGAEKITNNRFLNLFKLKAETKDGKCLDYLVASRARKVENLKAINHSSKADAVAIFATTEDNRVVLIRQYRYAIGDYIYELPAGLINDNEEVYKAAIREMKEETGLGLYCIEAFPPLYSSAGMTDESCIIVDGIVSGEISNKDNEDTEDIEIILVDKEEIVRILRNEKLCMRTALMLSSWLKGLELRE